MNWGKYDKEILTPYKKTGSSAQKFNKNTIVFSYTALRHVAYHAFQAGIAAQPADAADGSIADDEETFNNGAGW